MATKASPESESQCCRSSAENFLLVVATLIATVTFQAGVTPPGGVDNDGKAIYASQPGAFYVFLISNTIGLCTSILAIIVYIYRELQRSCPDKVTATLAKLATLTMSVALLATYASAIFAVTPSGDTVRFRYVMAAGALPFIVRGLISLFLCLFCKSRRKVKEPKDGQGTGTV